MAKETLGLEIIAGPLEKMVEWRLNRYSHWRYWSPESVVDSFPYLQEIREEEKYNLMVKRHKMEELNRDHVVKGLPMVHGQKWKGQQETAEHKRASRE